MDAELKEPVFNQIDSSVMFKLPRSFDELPAKKCLGKLRSFLQDHSIHEVRIDLSNVEWGDAEALMALAAILATYSRDTTNVALNLGDGSSRRHLIFLKFLAVQDFLKILSERETQLIWNGDQRDYDDLHHLFRNLPVKTHFTNADFIKAKLFKVSDLSGPEQVHDLTEKLVMEATERAIDPMFSSAPAARDALLQKMRKLLFELILNISEHAYSIDGYFCVFGRTLGEYPQDGTGEKFWKNYHKTRRDSVSMNAFSPAESAPWVELFVLDVGDGLLAHIEQWKGADKDINSKVESAESSVDPLFVMGPYFFRRPISRVARHDEKRTEITGLQYLGHVLATDHDFVRLWTDGCHLASVFPWRVSDAKSRDAPYKRVQGKRRDTLPGTAYTICIQPRTHNTPYNDKIWAKAGHDERERLAESLLKTPQVDTAIAFFDRSYSPSFKPPDTIEMSDQPALQAK